MPASVYIVEHPTRGVYIGTKSGPNGNQIRCSYNTVRSEAHRFFALEEAWSIADKVGERAYVLKLEFDDGKLAAVERVNRQGTVPIAKPEEGPGEAAVLLHTSKNRWHAPPSTAEKKRYCVVRWEPVLSYLREFHPTAGWRFSAFKTASGNCVVEVYTARAVQTATFAFIHGLCYPDRPVMWWVTLVHSETNEVLTHPLFLVCSVDHEGAVAQVEAKLDREEFPAIYRLEPQVVEWEGQVAYR